jgi:peroxiredoxin
MVAFGGSRKHALLCSRPTEHFTWFRPSAPRILADGSQLRAENVLMGSACAADAARPGVSNVSKIISAMRAASSLGVVGLGGWFGYQLLIQNGRLLVRIEALEQRLAELTGRPVGDDELPSGLPVGSVAHDFALPTLSGDTVTLSVWRGRHVALIFFDPGCRFCLQMLPDLARLDPLPDDDHPVPLIVSTGAADENRSLVERHGVRVPILLQEGGEVAHMYRAEGTPMGYLIDEHGMTASPLAVGAQALLQLANATAQPKEEVDDLHAQPWNGYSRSRFGSLASSHILRNGLKPGTMAPEFRLPRLDDGELALEELRGRRVLLVFSDPVCGPCNEVAPKLEEIHRRATELRILMVSRGDAEANREKVAEWGLTFPVVLQRRWEVSREYGMFATPIAFMVDANGVIEANVAVGAEAILNLAAAPR